MKRSESPEYISASQCGGDETASDTARFDALPVAEQDRILGRPQQLHRSPRRPGRRSHRR